MLPWIPAAIGAAGSLLGGAASSAGAKSANAAQIEASKEFAQNKHQWAVKDLKAAGLNPILSSTTPSAGGSAPTLRNEAEGIGKGLSEASAKAMDMRIKTKQEDNLDAQNALTVAQTKSAEEDVRTKKMENDIQEIIKGMKLQGWELVDGALQYVGEKAEGIFGDSPDTNASSAKTLPQTSPVTGVPKTVQEKIKASADRWADRYKDVNKGQGIKGHNLSLKGAQPVTSSWLQKNVKSYKEWLDKFGKDHYLNKRPSFGEKDYWRKLSAYRYIEYLRSTQ